MYFLVTNIPEKFHTPELRNFFSEMIEKGAFNCFHFRHRPHRNLMTLLSEKQSDLNEITANRSTNDKNSSSPSRITCRPGQDPSDECPDPHESIHYDKLGSNSLNPDYSNENTSNPDGGEIGLRPDNDERIKSPPLQKSPSNHWLSSGISGLTSLIAEKKQKAMKKNNSNYGLDSSDRIRELCESMNSKETVILQPREKDNLGLSDCDKSVNELSVKMINFWESDSDINMDSVEGNCCVCDVKEDFASTFKALYHKKYWVNREGEICLRQCLIFDLNLDFLEEKGDDTGKEYLTRGESATQRSKIQDVQNLIEFQPPSIMPQGNTGTPTLHFKDLIRACQLPGNIIGKLGLKFTHKRGKKFGQVPFDYGTEVCSGNVEGQEKYVVFTAAGDLIPASVDVSRHTEKSTKKLKPSRPKLELEKESEDGAEVEEWERYQSFHEDVTSQDRTKERLYEKEIELVWEKGGPGLVFYTDAQYWREQEGDFDEQTTDEWDVDMSIYYDKGAGDFDAQNSVAMLESNELRSGALAKSAFRRPKKQLDRGHQSSKQDNEGKRKIKGPSAPPEIGRFEAHTKGFGRRLLESQGWTDGLGLGRKGEGLPYALDNDGQHPCDKKGFGYHGEKLQGWGVPSTSSSRRNFSSGQDQEPAIRISTVFDSPKDVDPPVSHLRTSEPTRLTHRHQDIKFSKASDSP
ncbi:G patch domain-containing protein 3-like [Macrobrachium rosenbergii]|uniref:G patch domain-containing protein 3-like n=1 Tax=Macrobrachium rosenbergii TaxID=79674 RepID=UPI0034D6BD6B